jgi:hypothetical protein
MKDCKIPNLLMLSHGKLGFGRICQQHSPLLGATVKLSKYYTTRIYLIIRRDIHSKQDWDQSYINVCGVVPTRYP